MDDLRSADRSVYWPYAMITNIMSASPDDPIVRELVARAKASLIARRTILSLGTAGAAAAALAACATGSGSRPSAAKDNSSLVKTLTWANWPLYLDQDAHKNYPTLQGFEKQTGITVHYDVAVEDNNEYYSKVKYHLSLGQSVGADVVCLTDWMVGRWVGLGYAQRLDHANIPNLKNMDASLRSRDFDPGRHYTVPWQSGFAGLCWNTETVPGGLKQVSDLWQPALHGRVGVLSEMRDTIGLIMLEQGVDISGKSWGLPEFTAAIDVFRKQVDSGQIRNVKGNSYTDDLVGGRTDAAIVWSGDVEAMNSQVGKSKFAFALPETGGTLWSDNFIVPIGSQETANVEKLINYYYEPEVAAKVAAYVNYITPVDGAQQAMEKVDKSFVNDQLIFPNAETLKQAHPFRTLSNADDTLYSTNFQGVLLGAPH